MLDNVTTIVFSNTTPLHIITETTVKTNWTQFAFPLIIGNIILFFFIYKMFQTFSKSPSTNLLLWKFKKLTGRHTLLIRHNEQGLFNYQMITTSSIPTILKFLQKFKNKAFNLILDTPGGEVFATMFISKILKNYPNQVHVYIPNYAMSGGSLLALSGTKLYFNSHSCIGTIDPQISSWFDSGSASAWDEVVKTKKLKAKDKSFVYRRMGKQVQKSLYNHFLMLVKDKVRDPKAFAKFMTDGRVEHIYQLSMPELKKFGMEINNISPKEAKILSKLTRIKSEQTIFGR